MRRRDFVSAPLVTAAVQASSAAPQETAQYDTVLKGGHGRIWGTVVGAIMLTMIGNILNLTDAISNYLNGTVQGIIIIVAVYLQRASWRKSAP